MRFASCIIILSALFATACGGGGGSSSNSNSSTASSVSSSSSSSESSSSTSSVSSSSSSVPAVAPESAPANLTLQLNPIKQFSFSWDAVEGADHYQLFENADGASGFTQVADNIEVTSYDHEVALYLRTNASYMVQACNMAGCSGESETVSVSGNLAEAVGYIKAPVALGSVTLMSDQGYEYTASQGFGNIVALSGDGMTLAATITSDFGDVTDTAGVDAVELFKQSSRAVYIFTKADTGWQQTGKISDRGATSLSLSDNGELLAIGLLEENGGSTGINGDESDQSASYSGAAYLYRNSGGWQQEAYIKASNARAGDQFGNSVALSADGATLAVGAYAESGLASGVNGDETSRGDQSFIGAAYVFTDGENGWVQEAYIKAIDNDRAPLSSAFGVSLALAEDGLTLAVGASGYSFLGPRSTPEKTRYSGVHLYRKTEGQWQSDTTFNSPEPILGSSFGSAVALSADGTQLAVGEDFLLLRGVSSLRNKGKVHTYLRESEQWALQATLLPETGIKANSFGSELAMSASGDLLAVCARYDGSDSVALEPDSATDTLTRSGAAYVFTEQEGVWLQQSFIKAPNPDTYDDFCGSLGLSANGSTLAVGARGESGAATGVGGLINNDADGTGAVYLY